MKSELAKMRGERRQASIFQMLRASGRERSPLSPSIPSYCFSTEKREKKGGSSELEGKLKIDVRLYRRTGKKERNRQ